jgi:hypothetical protein
VFPGVHGDKEYRHIIDRISAATVPEPNPDLIKPIPLSGMMAAVRLVRSLNWWGW